MKHVKFLYSSRRKTNVHQLFNGLRNSLFGINFFLSSGYLLGSYLGSLLLLPPSPLAPIWLSTGIAFAGINKYGVKAVPGVFLGAFVAEILGFSRFSSSVNSEYFFLLAITPGIAVVVQTLTGVYMSKRVISIDNFLLKEVNILRFMILVGPVACIVSASIGTGLLFFLNAIEQKDLLSMCLLWWLSDTYGVMLIAPSEICINDTIRNKDFKRLIWVVLPMVILFGLTLILLDFGKRQELAKVATYFDRRTDVLHSELQNEFRYYLQNNEILVAFFNGSMSVTAEEFSLFTKPLLSGRPEIRSLAWLPRVTPNERARYEEMIGVPFKIANFGHSNSKQISMRKDEFYPVLFVEPHSVNQTILGLDLSSNGQFQEVIWNAIGNSQSVLSHSISLQSKTPNNQLITIFTPVYKQNVSLNTPDERILSLRGFIASDLDPILKVQTIQNQFHYFRLLLKITDGDNVLLDQNQRVYSKNTDLQQFNKTKILKIVDRELKINYRAAPDFYEEMITWNLWWLFMGCSLFTVFIGISLLMLTGRMKRTEELVKRRTSDLEREIDERRHTETALKESETRLSLAIKGSNDAPWDWDLEKNTIYYSPQWWRMLGYEPDELPATFELRQVLIHPEDLKLSHGVLMKAMQCGQDMHSGELRLRHKDGHYVPVLERCFLSRDEDGNVLRVSGTNMDLTARRQTQLLEDLRSFMLDCMTANMNLDQLLTAIVLKLENLWPETFCSILLLDPSGKFLHLGAAPSLPVIYNEAIDGLAIGENVGCCGNTAFTGQITISKDISNDPRWEPVKSLALQAGLVSCWSTPLNNLNGKILGTFAIYQKTQACPGDHELKVIEMVAHYTGIAVERKRTEIELKLSAAVFEQSSEGFMVTDAERNIIRVNPAFTKITGYTESEVVGLKPRLLSSGQHDSEFFQDIWRTIDKLDCWQGEIWNRRKSGEVYPELLNISSIRDQQGLVSEYVGVFADITQLKASEAKLEFLAHHDPLTSLPNRLRLFYRLEHGISEAGRDNRGLALLMLDLDRFKDVNDSFGHPAGDQLLQQVADFLVSRVREIDTVARLGGDEFAIVLENITKPETVVQLAQEFIDGLKKPWLLNNIAEVLIGGSIGISLYPENGNTPELLLQYADAALYKAKKEGRNRYAFYSDDLTEASRQRIILEARLRKALVQNELRVFYQPQVNVENGKIVGAEALVRWQDPEQGLLLPDTFIPLAEQTGLIQAIGKWVLNQVCLDGNDWLEQGIEPLMLCVNISQHQFRQSDLCELVSSVIAETGYPCISLELELTESGLFGDEQSVTKLLQELQGKGISLALDDFGTGYSSLSYLKRLPLDTLKIDKSFIAEIPHQQEDMEITSAIITLAHVLGLNVVAEGVENEEQLKFVKEKGCDKYQGYLHSHPMPADEFISMLIDKDKKP